MITRLTMQETIAHLPTIRLLTGDRLVLYIALGTSLQRKKFIRIKLYIEHYITRVSQTWHIWRSYM